MLEWFSIQWFLPAQLKEFIWEQPGYLYAMLLLPLPYILRWLFHFKARQKLEIALIEREAVSSPFAILRHIPSVLMLLFISLILMALARPQITDVLRRV